MTVSVETLERATLAAVPPQSCVEHDGWLIPLDPGPVSRAHSAVPLTHSSVPDLSVIPVIVDIYRRHGLPPMFRIPTGHPHFTDCENLLHRLGFASSSPTEMMVGTVAALTAAPATSVCTVNQVGGPGWEALFTHTADDPVTARQRADILRRSTDTVYGSVPVADSPGHDTPLAAVGCTCLAEGLVGVHGMRTDPAHRRQGHARSLLNAFGQAANNASITVAYLQVEVGNDGARALYTDCGFVPVWVYQYWSLPS